jgi:hypothetical protein
MAKQKTFKAGQGYTKEDWDAVSDNPELTAEDFAKANRSRKYSRSLQPRSAGDVARTRRRQSLVSKRLSDVLARRLHERPPRSRGKPVELLAAPRLEVEFSLTKKALGQPRLPYH